VCGTCGDMDCVSPWQFGATGAHEGGAELLTTEVNMLTRVT